MGMILFVVLGVAILLILVFLKKNKTNNTLDRTAWDENERMAIKILKQRLETGDITQEEYENKIKEIETKRNKS